MANSVMAASMYFYYR